jgi:hypothetical protein
MDGEIYSRVHKSLSLATVLCHMYPIYTLVPYFFKVYLVISWQLNLCHPSVLFPTVLSFNFCNSLSILQKQLFNFAWFH